MFQPLVLEQRVFFRQTLDMPYDVSGHRRFRVVQHFEGVATVRVEGDSATARSPHIHTHKGRTGSADWNLIQTGYFVDRLERRPEGWRIVHRTLEITWMDTFPVTVQAQ